MINSLCVNFFSNCTQSKTTPAVSIDEIQSIENGYKADKNKLIFCVIIATLCFLCAFLGFYFQTITGKLIGALCLVISASILTYCVFFYYNEQADQMKKILSTNIKQTSYTNDSIDSSITNSQEFQNVITELIKIKELIETYNIKIDFTNIVETSYTLAEMTKLQNNTKKIIEELTNIHNIVKKNLNALCLQKQTIQDFLSVINSICKELDIDTTTKTIIKIKNILQYINQMQQFGKILGLPEASLKNLETLTNSLSQHCINYNQSIALQQQILTTGLSESQINTLLTVLFSVLNTEMPNSTFVNTTELIAAIKDQETKATASNANIKKFCTLFQIQVNANTATVINNFLQQLQTILQNTDLESFILLNKQKNSSAQQAMSKMTTLNLSQQQIQNIIQQLNTLYVLYSENEKKLHLEGFLEQINNENKSLIAMKKQLFSIFQADDISLINNTLSNINTSLLNQNNPFLNPINNNQLDSVALQNIVTSLKKTLNQKNFIQGFNKLVLCSQINQVFKYFTTAFKSKNIHETTDSLRKIILNLKANSILSSDSNLVNATSEKTLCNNLNKITGMEYIIKIANCENICKLNQIGDYKVNLALLKQLEQITGLQPQVMLEILNVLITQLGSSQHILKTLQDNFVVIKKLEQNISFLGKQCTINPQLFANIQALLNLCTYDTFKDQIITIKKGLESHNSLKELSDKFGMQIDDLIKFIKDLQSVLVYTQYNQDISVQKHIENLFDFSFIEGQAKLMAKLLYSIEPIKGFRKSADFIANHYEDIATQLTQLQPLIAKYGINLSDTKENIAKYLASGIKIFQAIQTNKSIDLSLIIQNLQLLKKNLPASSTELTRALNTIYQTKIDNDTMLNNVVTAWPKLTIQTLSDKAVDIVQILINNLLYLNNTIAKFRTLTKNSSDLKLLNSQYQKLSNILALEGVSLSQDLVMKDIIKWSKTKDLTLDNIGDLVVKSQESIVNLYQFMQQSNVFSQTNITLSDIQDMYNQIAKLNCSVTKWVQNIDRMYERHILAICQYFDEYKTDKTIAYVLNLIIQGDLSQLNQLLRLKLLLYTNRQKQIANIIQDTKDANMVKWIDNLCRALINICQI